MDKLTIPKECCIKQEHEGERRKTRREGGRMKGGGRGREGEREVFAKNLLPPLCPQSIPCWPYPISRFCLSWFSIITEQNLDLWPSFYFLFCRLLFQLLPSNHKGSQGPTDGYLPSYCPLKCNPV